MAKAKLTYAVRETLAPGETVPSTIPVLTDRKAPVELETILERCIDRGLVLGAKASAAHGIAEGIAEQICHEFCLGRGVAFGQYFYGRLYLNGTVGPNGDLTDANRINVRLFKGDDFRLTLSDFSLSFEGDATAPKLEFAVSYTGGDGIGTRGEVVHGKKVGINGRNLWASGDTDAVTFTEIDADGEPQVVEVAAFDTNSPDVLTFDCPAALVSGKSYAVKVFRTDANGVTRSTAARNVVVSGEAPSGITLTGVHAPGIESPMIGQDSTICFDGTGLDAWGDSETDKVEVKNNRAEEAEWSPVGEITIEYNDGMLKLSDGVWGTLADLSISTPGSEPRFRVTIGGSEAEIVATVAEP